MNRKIVKYFFGALIVVAVAVTFQLSRAATNVPNLEAESGVPAGNASVVSDSSASAGRAIAFGGFKHPGVLFDKTRLDLIKAKVNANAQPWLDAYNKALSDQFSQDNFPANQGVVATVQCGSNSNPDVGCTALQKTSKSAYAHALLFYITGQTSYASRARDLINSWSAVLQNFTDANANFEASWTAELLVPAAEILRYTPGSGWTQADSDQFAAMLNRAYVPQVDDASWNGAGANRLMSMEDATISIAVFTNDSAMFNRAITRWRQQVPSVVFMSSDTNDNYPNLKGLGYPIPPPGWYKATPSVTTADMDTYWRNPGQYESGLEAETCRDMDHTTMGFNAMMHVAETAYIQGVDLYSEEQSRIVTGLEFNARYITEQLSSGSVPSWLCGGLIAQQGAGPVHQAGWELAYSHYHDVKGLSLPYTKTYIDTYVRDPNNTVLYTVFSGLPTLVFALSN